MVALMAGNVEGFITSLYWTRFSIHRRKGDNPKITGLDKFTTKWTTQTNDSIPDIHIKFQRILLGPTVDCAFSLRSTDMHTACLTSSDAVLL